MDRTTRGPVTVFSELCKLSVGVSMRLQFPCVLSLFYCLSYEPSTGKIHVPDHRDPVGCEFISKYCWQDAVPCFRVSAGLNGDRDAFLGCRSLGYECLQWTGPRISLWRRNPVGRIICSGNHWCDVFLFHISQHIGCTWVHFPWTDMIMNYPQESRLWAIPAAASSLSRMYRKYRKIQMAKAFFSSLSPCLFRTWLSQFKGLLPAWSKRGALPLTFPMQLLGNTK